MSKLSLIVPFIKLCLKNRKDFLKSLYHFTHETDCRNAVINDLKLPKGLPVIDLLELFPDFHETIENYSYLDGTSRAIDICILKLLAKNIPNCQYIEFGTWRGESILNVAGIADKCYAISFSEQEMRDRKFKETVIKAGRFFTKNKKNIIDIQHDTQTYDFTHLEKKFDLIFVDADHEYLPVKKDTENAFKLLKDENSIIVWHDYGKSYETLNWQVIRGIVEGSPEHARNKIYSISNSLCAIYTNKKYKTSYPEANIPTKTFTVSLSAKKL